MRDDEENARILFFKLKRQEKKIKLWLQLYEFPRKFHRMLCAVQHYQKEILQDLFSLSLLVMWILNSSFHGVLFLGCHAALSRWLYSVQSKICFEVSALCTAFCEEGDLDWNYIFENLCLYYVNLYLDF